MPRKDPLVVFCHLPWDFVFQRPQHIMSRMAEERRVLFIEEPSFTEGEPRWELRSPLANLTVCKPHTPVQAGGFAAAQVEVLRRMVADLVEKEELHGYVAWLYTPMALPIAKALDPRVVVYDCMDELSAFKFAPRELKDNETQLLRWADVVFTGGPSLYRAKIGKHDNLHCFPSSVDATHFRQAWTTPEPADQADIPHPRLGFYGVIDERMDLDLIAALATEHPEWQIVLVGPTAKIDPADLPRQDNIHYLGPRKYAELPAYLSGWDVCLLPFALNESTRYISPTKILEYMAVELPIVSTPITDVVEPYGDIAYIGEGQEGFVRACEQALDATDSLRAERASRMRQVLARTSWDRTVQQMGNLIERAASGRTSSSDSLQASPVSRLVRSQNSVPAIYSPSTRLHSRPEQVRPAAPSGDTAV